MKIDEGVKIREKHLAELIFFVKNIMRHKHSLQTFFTSHALNILIICCLHNFKVDTVGQLVKNTQANKEKI